MDQRQRATVKNVDERATKADRCSSPSSAGSPATIKSNTSNISNDPHPATSQVNSNQQQQLTAQNKRKEKARIAARARRSQEASIIMEMANELHISQERMRRIDKATIIKLAIDYIKAFDILLAFCQRGDLACQQQQEQQDRAVTNANQAAKIYPNISNHHNHEKQEPEQVAQTAPQQQQHQIHEGPKLSTSSIFAPRTNDVDTHFLIINEKENGESAFVLKPDTEIQDEDDLTHLAPQAGDVSISLDVEPLDGIKLDQGLFVHTGSPPTKKSPILSQLEANHQCCNHHYGIRRLSGC